MLGMDSMYFRATPQKNSEDAVVFQEYTLYNVENCGQQLKVLMQDGSYQGGDYTAGLFGVEFQQIPEADIAIDEWYSKYPRDTQPQKGDIIYVALLNKIFEVNSASVVYGAGNMPMYFKAALHKYTPKASRRESEDLKQTIDEMTVSQEELFGETISQEVADTVVEVETAYNTTSTVDPMKDADLSSVVYEELYGPHNVKISNAYYDMLTASKPVTYHTAASWEPDSERPYWLFSCWLRYTDNSKKKEYSLRKITPITQDGKRAFFRLETPLKLRAGDTVTVSKGSLVTLTGEITDQFEDCETAPIVSFPLADIQLMERKLKDWHKTGPFKIQKSAIFSPIRSDNASFGITLNPTSGKIRIDFGGLTKETSLPLDTTLSKWTYIMAGLAPDNVSVNIQQLTSDNTIETIFDKTLKANAGKPKAFSFETLSIPSAGQPVAIRNIRLYENEEPMTPDIAERDALTEITENASKLILVDSPNVAQKADFYSPAR